MARHAVVGLRLRIWRALASPVQANHPQPWSVHAAWCAGGASPPGLPCPRRERARGCGLLGRGGSTSGVWSVYGALARRPRAHARAQGHSRSWERSSVNPQLVSVAKPCVGTSVRSLLCELCHGIRLCTLYLRYCHAAPVVGGTSITNISSRGVNDYPETSSYRIVKIPRHFLLSLATSVPSRRESEGRAKKRLLSRLLASQLADEPHGLPLLETGARHRIYVHVTCSRHIT